MPDGDLRQKTTDRRRKRARRPATGVGHSACYTLCIDELTGLVQAWSVRARWQRGLRWVFFGLACGLGISLTVAVAARAFPLMSVARLVALTGVLCGSAVAVALAWPWMRAARRDTLSWAREFDRRLGLQERISTALEFRDGALEIRNDALRKRQLGDAEACAAGVDARASLPLHISRRDATLAALLALAVAAAIALPNPQQDALARREAFQQAAHAQAEQIAEAEKTLQNSPFLSADEKRGALEALEQARRKLEDPATTPEQALAALNEAQARLDALQNASSPAAREDLKQAGRTMTPDDITRQMADALASGDFQTAAQQMRQLTRQNGQPLTESERQRVANQLDQMAREVQGSDPQMAAQLREAAQDLRENRPGDAQQQLNEAAGSLDRASQSQASENALQQAEQSTADARQRVAEAAGQTGPQGQPGQNAQGADQPTNPAGAQGQTGDSNSQGQTAGSTAGQPQSGDASGPSSASGHSEDTGTDQSVYAPGPRLNQTGSNVVLPESQTKTAPNPNSDPRPAAPGASLVPYQQVYRDYARTADQALQSGEVPAALRDYIRDYFSSLDPRR